ncbi:M1 family metallopeptidase [Algoriphagus namhaensis]|uniref:M1 family metallopeptidase n=1 Tax=Algoriphagus namhaensis TaxID=915353 RepID=A0ABV8ANT4_9BACT
MIKRIVLAFLLIGTFQFSHAQKNWDWGGPIDPLQKQFEVLHYKLDLAINPDERSIEGSATVTFEAEEKLEILRLNLIDEYKVTQVLMNGDAVEFTHSNDILDIRPIDCTCNSVEIFYSGVTPIAINPPWNGGFTWEKDGFGNHWMGLSSQGEGAKIFMPALDHPSSEPREGVDLYFTVDHPYFVAANGTLVETEKMGDKVRYHWSTSYPINNYNINFTLGVFHSLKDVFISSSGAEVPIEVIILKENEAKAAAIMEVLKVSTATHEKYFGAYPWPNDKVAIVETPYLGMEHQTINAYGNNYQFVPMGNTQYDWLLHHELGHEWFGNKVSVGDWADMWLHEGITAYGDWLFYYEHGGMESYLEKAKEVGMGIPHDKPVVGKINSTEEEAYHSEIYTKGAFVMHSLRWVLGDDVFFPFLLALASDERFTYQNQIDTDEFISFVQEFSGQDLADFLNLYLRTTKLPQVKISAKGKNSYQIKLDGIKFEIPVEVQTSEGIQRIMLGNKKVKVSSTSAPVVDPNGWLMLKQ